MSTEKGTLAQGYLHGTLAQGYSQGGAYYAGTGARMLQAGYRLGYIYWPKSRLQGMLHTLAQGRHYTALSSLRHSGGTGLASNESCYVEVRNRCAAGAPAAKVWAMPR